MNMNEYLCSYCACNTEILAGDTHTLTHLTDKEGAQRGFLMVILNIYIDDMNRLQSFLLS